MRAPWKRWILWGLVGGSLVGSLVYAFRPQSLPVDLATVVGGPMMVTVDDEGETRVRDVFLLSAPVTGRARRIELAVGDAVLAERTVIAEIEPNDPGFLDVRSEAQAEADLRAADANKALAKAELAEAMAEFEFAKSELRRARQLSETDTISQRALDEAQRRYKMAQAAVATTEARLQVGIFAFERAQALLMPPVKTHFGHELCECVPLIAPVSGRILRVIHESEGVVRAGEPLVEIGDPTELEIIVDFLSSEAVKVVPGQRVIIEEWGGGTPLSGRVRLVEPVGFTKVSALGIEEQRVNVVIDFSGPTDDWLRLGHGYQLEVRVVLWEGEKVRKLPLTALFRHAGEWAVFVEEDGNAQLRRVTIGRRSGLEAEIAEGVDYGDRVVVSPSDRVADGTRIHPRA